MVNFAENLSSCIWFAGRGTKNALASIAAGSLFFIGWWMAIDANVMYPEIFKGSYHVLGIIGTISLFMVNSATSEQLQLDTYDAGCLGPRGIRIWLFVGFVFAFAPVIAACYIYFSEFFGTQDRFGWAGAAMLIQNIFIFIGSLVFKFCRAEDAWA